MAASVHQTVGFIEIPAEGPWSADALVKETLGICAYVWDHERFIIAARVPGSPAIETARLFADMPQLQSELEELFEGIQIEEV